jgi:hypothetical protein
MRVANQFIDPVTNETWNWQVNHKDETGGGSTSANSGLQRNFTYSSPTSNIGLIRQQAAATPLTLGYKGTFLKRVQHQEFLRWWTKCEFYSIFLRDFAGELYEVMITGYNPQRKPVAINPQDPGDPSTHAPLWVYDFEIDMDVISFLSGDYHNAYVQA